jgi:hypothetical protein
MNGRGLRGCCREVLRRVNGSREERHT